MACDRVADGLCSRQLPLIFDRAHDAPRHEAVNYEGGNAVVREQTGVEQFCMRGDTP